MTLRPDAGVFAVGSLALFFAVWIQSEFWAALILLFACALIRFIDRV